MQVEAAFGGLAALNRVWFSGTIIVLCILLMYSAAQPAARQDSHQAFWLSHHLFGLFWFCLLLHGPVFWSWAGVPLLLYIWRRVRAGQGGAVLREATLEEPDVLRLAFDNTDGKLFKYEEGMYVKIKAPDISATEWHPFTISSAPKSHVLTVHIRVTARSKKDFVSWTAALHEHIREWYNPHERSNIMFYDPETPTEIGRRHSIINPEKPLLLVDGPYAAPCTNIPAYNTVMLVSGGIGLTPFASALTSLLCYKFRDAVNPAVKEKIRPRHVYFYWLFQMKDYTSFKWFAKLLSNLRCRYLEEIQQPSYLRYSQGDTGGGSGDIEEISLRINLFVTRGDPKISEAPERDPVQELAALAQRGVPVYEPPPSERPGVVTVKVYGHHFL
jgi:hypothetical protein